MDGLHQRDKSAEGQLCDPGEARLQHDREGAELQRYNAADDRSGNDPPALRGSALTKPAAPHDRAPYQVIADEAAVKRHVPYVCSQGHKAAVGEEKTLYGEDHNHREESGLGSQQRGKQHAAAHMAGGPGAGDRVIDHLSGKNQRGGNGHDGKLLRFIVLHQLVNRNPCGRAGGCVHDCGHGG